MPRQLNLRQIEAFKAVIENGTISRAAQVLNISQPAMSKLIGHLEFDSGLRLFDRVKGRLAPTTQGTRLYEEVERIFSGVRQVENAVEVIRREEQGRIAIGVLPSLANSFITRITTSFLNERPNVFCTVQARESPRIIDWLVAKRLDVGLVSGRTENPYLVFEPVMVMPLVCLMPADHPLAEKDLIEPRDLNHVRFVAFDADVSISHLIEDVLERYNVQPDIVLRGIGALTVCEFVASGLGVALVHPFMAQGLHDRVAIRRFEPEVPFGFQLCRGTDSRNVRMVDSFVEHLRVGAAEIVQSLRTAHLLEGKGTALG